MTTKAQHTPGPWSFSAGTATIRDKANHWIATMDSWDGAVVPDNEANGRLIAAAPELLDALEQILDCDGDLNSMDFKQARAAIAKARGSNL